MDDFENYEEILDDLYYLIVKLMRNQEIYLKSEDEIIREKAKSKIDCYRMIASCIQDPDNIQFIESQII